MKRYGIRITLPSDDPFRAPHLLGESWAGLRWFDSEAERDRLFDEMTDLPPYYRDGDTPNQVLAKIDEDVGAS